MIITPGQKLDPNILYDDGVYCLDECEYSFTHQIAKVGVSKRLQYTSGYVGGRKVKSMDDLGYMGCKEDCTHYRKVVYKWWLSTSDSPNCNVLIGLDCILFLFTL